MVLVEEGCRGDAVRRPFWLSLRGVNGVRDEAISWLKGFKSQEGPTLSAVLKVRPAVPLQGRLMALRSRGEILGFLYSNR